MIAFSPSMMFLFSWCDNIPVKIKRKLVDLACPKILERSSQTTSICQSESN